MDKKIALVTGASRGIGAAIADLLQDEGYFVIGTATSEKGAASITQRLSEKGGEGFALNVCSDEQITEVLANIKEKYGVVSVLVNNAGIVRDNLLLRMKDHEWSDVYETNCRGVFAVTRACLRGMVKQRFGRIINITSVVGASGNPGQTNYCAMKAAVVGFSKSLSLEVASRGITVNCVAPGFIETEMTAALTDVQKDAFLKVTPMKRMGAPKDIADAVCFLASDKAGYVTGQTLHINGGLYLAS